MTNDVGAHDLPQNWTWKKLKYVAHMAAGDAITADEIQEEDDYPVYGGNGLRGYTDRFNRSGDFVLIGRQGALCGNVNYASGDFWASEHAIVADLQGQAEVRWLGELLRFMNLNQYSQSAAHLGLIVCPEHRHGHDGARECAFLDHITHAIGRTEGPGNAGNGTSGVNRDRGLDFERVSHAGCSCAVPFHRASSRSRARGKVSARGRLTA